MKNSPIKNIIIVTMSLVGIMIVSTVIVISFNYLFGFSTDTNNEHVSTIIAAVAFCIAIIWKYLYDKIDSSETDN